MSLFSSLKMLFSGLFCFTASLNGAKNHPFNYDLHLTILPGSSSRAMIVMHGMGSDYQLIHVLKEMDQVKDTLISFNFPDHGKILGADNLNRVSFGTIDEVLPALFVLKKTLFDRQFQEISLYGFSAGGGVIINLLGVLNTTTYDADLKKLGIGPIEKKRMNEALQKGVILLDAPLKSVREIIDFRGNDPELDAIAKHYQENNMEPIDTLLRLSHLSYQILVYFEKPDEILSNRDDRLFYERLKKANSQGSTVLLEGHTQGHNGSHKALWDYYSKMQDVLK